MSNITEVLAGSVPGSRTVRSEATKLGVGAFAAAAALVVYGAYGDPHPKANQEAAVPFLVVVGAVAALVVFGLLVPKALRSIREERTHAARWGLGLSVVALVTAPVVFWSGVPLICGVAGAWLGRRTREQRTVAGSPTRSTTVAIVVGCLVVAASVLVTVLGNTVAGS